VTRIVVKVPLLTLDNAINFSNELFQLPDSEEYVFDFSNMDWVEPFGMLYISSQLLKYRQSKQFSKFCAENYKHCDYAGHMGFFKTFGLNFGKQPGEASGSLNYLPITSIEVDNLNVNVNLNWRYVTETIERWSSFLAYVLTRQSNSNLFETLKYSICEIIRNVIEHSRSKHIYYCAQYWSRQNIVEVSILDTGIGIRQSLSKNPFLRDISSDRDALHQSLLPGISGKFYKKQKTHHNQDLRNVGFGLYMTSRLCRNSENFFICSGNTGMLLCRETKKAYNTNFSGTALRLTLNTQNIDSLSKSLNKFRKEGQEITKKLKGVGRISSEAASFMLTKDFNKSINNSVDDGPESISSSDDIPF
jgi:hypothetical protein